MTKLSCTALETSNALSKLIKELDKKILSRKTEQVEEKLKLTKEQEKIVTTNADKVVVIAAAAAGKTATLVERVRFLLNLGEKPEGIVVITFTNAAAEEIAERLGHPLGLFVGTIHSYANYLLKCAAVDTSDILENEKFDKLFEMVEEHIYCIKPVNHLLLDESQDSNPIHFSFIFDLVKPKHYILMGDHRQSIYRWNGADPDYILDLMTHRDVTVYELTQNYRNGSDILSYAKSIINLAGYDYQDHAIAMRDTKGKVVEVELNPTAVAKTIKKYGNYGKWFVLTRTNDQLEEMMYFLKKYDVPATSFKRSELNNKELFKTMQEDTVKVLTIHTSKGLEADNVIVVGAKFYNTEEKCISYVAATRARNLLVWTRVPNKARQARMVSNWER